MKFTAVWARAAEADLARLWVNANSHVRKTIQIAADACDAALANDAQFVGQPRSGNLRTVRIPPLIIDFEVIVDDCLARVLSIRLEPTIGSSNGKHG